MNPTNQDFSNNLIFINYPQNLLAPQQPQWSYPQQQQWAHPQQPQLTAPQQPQWAAPQQPQWAAPQQPQWVAPQQPQWVAPQQPQWSYPQQSQWTAPQHPQWTQPQPQQQQITKIIQQQLTQIIQQQITQTMEHEKTLQERLLQEQKCSPKLFVQLKSIEKNCNESIDDYENHKISYVKELINYFSEFCKNIITLIGTQNTNFEEYQFSTNYLSKVFKIFKNFDLEQGLDENQIKKIMDLSIRITPAFKDIATENSIFFKKNLTNYNVIDFLISASECSEIHFKICLEHIKEWSGLTCITQGNKILSIEISDLKIPLNEVSSIIAQIITKFTGLSISFSPQNIKVLDLLGFINTQGQYIQELHLEKLGDLICDNIIDVLIENCPTLAHLSIKSDKITGYGLSSLNYSANLDTLILEDCGSLTDIPTPLPLKLTDINLNGCYQLLDEDRLSAISTFIELKIIKNMPLKINNYGFQDPSKLYHLITEKLTNHFRNSEIDPELLIKSANSIVMLGNMNPELFEYNSNHPLIQQAKDVLSQNETNFMSIEI